MQNDPPQWFTEAISSPFQKRTLTVTGCPINYLVWGEPDKPPLVLVHGGAAHAMWWSIVAPELAHHYYVIAPDLSGHGDSGRRGKYPGENIAPPQIGRCGFVMRRSTRPCRARPRPPQRGHTDNAFRSAR